MSVILGQRDTEYHANQAVGSTTAKLCLKSMRLYRDRIDGTDPQPDKEHFKIGRLAHMMVLEPDRFRAQVVTDGPINPKTGAMYGRDTKAFGEWQVAHPDVTVVEPWLYTMMDRMPGKVRDLFAEPGNSEVSIYQTVNGVQVKCRPDRLTICEALDLKTIDDVDNIPRAMRQRMYWFSQEWYKRVMLEEFGEPRKFRFVFVEKKPPFRWRITRLSEEACEEGAALVRAVMTAIRSATESGKWDDVGNIETEITWPDCGHFDGDES